VKPWLLSALLLGSLVLAQTAKVTALLTGRELMLVAQDATGLYLSQIVGQRVNLLRVPKQGGTPRVLTPPARMGNADFSALWNVGRAFALGRSVYFDDDGSRILKLPQAGGAKLSVVFQLRSPPRNPMQIMGVVSDGADLYVFGGVYDQTRQCAAGANTVLWRVPVLGGGKPVQLARGLPCPVDTALRRFDAMVDDLHVYFLQVDREHRDAGGVWRVPKRGGAATHVLEALRSVRQIKLSGAFVYALVGGGTGDRTRLIRTPKAGGVVQTLASLENPWFVDGDGLVVMERLDSPQSPTLRVVTGERVRVLEPPWVYRDVRRVLSDGATLYWVERVRFSMNMALRRARL
jgi:hypothetical protein